MSSIVCKPGWIYVHRTNKCYKYIKDQPHFTFDSAREYCRGQAPNPWKGDSVSVKDQLIEEFVKLIQRKRGPKHIWTSGHRIRGKWFWGDGTEVTYANWLEPGLKSPGKPDNTPGFDFLEIVPSALHHGRKWGWNNMAKKGWGKFNTICEY